MSVFAFARPRRAETYFPQSVVLDRRLLAPDAPGYLSVGSGLAAMRNGRSEHPTAIQTVMEWMIP
ncbi:MAG TPA: hypothetical protein VLE46_14250 [Nitrospira sp.]|nr:hypothetical protein [Nitrospira sp.]